MAHRHGKLAPDHEERAMARVLVETFRLSRGERSRLVDGAVSGSAVIEAIGAILDEFGWYPADWRPGQPYDGVLLEAVAGDTAADDGAVVHEQREVGVGRFASAPTRRVDLPTAARLVVRETFREKIDGVRVDWSR